jgi:C4-dicarboxylate-specific signal transduction histidine kinase
MSRLEDKEAVKKGLSTIVSQIDRISKLIYTLLGFARKGSDAVATVPVVPYDVYQQVFLLLESRLQKLGIEFSFGEGRDLKVKADKNGLEQIFLNLAMNAIHAIESSGTKTSDRKPWVKIDARVLETSVEIRFQDNGCGMSPEQKQNLFKPFFTTKDVGQGTGLGLVNVQQIISSWGGSVWAESTLGSGTSFFLKIPRAIQKAKVSRIPLNVLEEAPL